MLYYLAQVNIGKLLAPIDDPAIAEFVNQLDEMNQLAEKSPGFIWRLKEGENSSVHATVYDDPLLKMNLSVWRSIDDLKSYAYQSDHLKVLKDRGKWFAKMKEPHLALWWHPVGDLMPDANEAKKRLDHLNHYGPTGKAFTFRKIFPMPVV